MGERHALPVGNSQAAIACEFEALYAQVGAYYDRKIKAHGPTAHGVDWPCQPTQELRFVQLLKVCDFSQPFSINDLGCGYGALRGFLKKRWPKADIDYLGVDLVPAMIDQAARLWHGRPATRFAVGATCSRTADYSVTSGTFNVKLGQPTDAWVRFVRITLADMCASSRKGFAVNFLSRTDPGMGVVPELYRTQPDPWVDYCENELGMRVELLAKYGMREFTVLARK